MLKETLQREKVPHAQTAAQIAKKQVCCINSDATLTEAAKLMRENHVGDLVVCDKNDKPIGIITDRDILIETLPHQVEAKTLYVSDIMARSLATARENEDVFSMIQTMKSCGIARLPVIDENGRLCGIVTAKCLFNVLSRGLCEIAEISERQHKNEADIRH